MKTASVCALMPVLLAGTASAADTFLSSPPYDITITLDYTAPADPYTSQAGIETYRSVSCFSLVSFGPSYMTDLPAMFATEAGPMGSGALLPSMQTTGTGVIETCVLQPAWEDEDPIEGVVTSGPERFEPMLTLVPASEALDGGCGDEYDMPPVPLVPTLYFQFDEHFGILDPPLEWSYDDFVSCFAEGSAFVFPVTLSDLGQGSSFEIQCPYGSETATGTWTIRFEAQE